MSLLSIIQSASTELNLNSPSNVVAATDTQVLQMFSLVKSDGLDLLRRYDWQTLTKETSFLTVATAQQTTLATVAPDFFRYVDETMNNRTQHWRVLGPLSPQEYQRRLSLGAQVGVVNSFRIRGDAILFFPTPPAGNSIYFEYISSKWVQSSGGVPKTTFTLDDDTSFIDEEVLKLGVKWRFLKAKGLDYSEEFRSYEEALESIFGSDGARGPVDMTGSTIDWTIPALPDGSWNI